MATRGYVTSPETPLYMMYTVNPQYVPVHTFMFVMCWSPTCTNVTLAYSKCVFFRVKCFLTHQASRLKQVRISSLYINVVNWYRFPSCISKTLRSPFMDEKTCYKHCIKPFFFPLVSCPNTIPLIRNIPYSIKQAFNLPIKSDVATIEIVPYYFSPLRKTSLIYLFIYLFF